MFGPLLVGVLLLWLLGLVLLVLLMLAGLALMVGWLVRELKWMQHEILFTSKTKSKGEDWATGFGWFIPRKYRHVIGDNPLPKRRFEFKN